MTETQQNFTQESTQKHPNAVERFIYKYTPAPVKRAANWVVDRLPEKWANWVRRNKFLAICIVYTIRGLFFRPSMWALYAAIFAYFELK